MLTPPPHPTPAPTHTALLTPNAVTCFPALPQGRDLVYVVFAATWFEQNRPVAEAAHWPMDGRPMGDRKLREAV